MMIESNFSYEAAYEIILEYLKLLNESDINSASVHAKLTELQIYLDTLNKQFTLFYKDICAKTEPGLFGIILYMLIAAFI